MAINLYHQWLGLDSQSVHPHYFQLLGVSSKPSSEEKYRVDVATAAAAKLEILKKIDAGPHEKQLEQLKLRIKQAAKVLADPKLRTAYLQKLKSQSQAAQKSAGSTVAKHSVSDKNNREDANDPGSLRPGPVPVSKTPPTATPGSAPATNPKANPTPPATIPVAAQPPIPAATHSSTPIPAATPAIPTASPSNANAGMPPIHSGSGQTAETGAAPEVLAAIPLAVPLHQNPPSAIPVATAATPTMTSNNPASSDFNAETLPIQVRPVRKRRKSKGGPILAVFMLLIAVGSAIGLYYMLPQLMEVAVNNSEQNLPEGEEVAQVDQAGHDSVSPTAKGPTEPAGSTVAEHSSETSSTIKTGGFENIDPPLAPPGMRGPDFPNETENAPISPPQVNLENEDPFGIANNAEGQSDNLNPGQNQSTGSTKNGFFGEMTNSNVDPQPMPTNVEPSVAPTKSFTDVERIGLHRTFRRIRNSFLRRDDDTADKQILAAQRQFDELTNKGEFTLEPTQQPMRTHFEALRNAQELLDGFWAQVISSTKPLISGREIEVGNQILGFIESDDTGVLVRNAGSNIRYDFNFIPSGIAAALAEMGAIEDIPTWRLQLAAFYALYIHENPDYVDRIESLVSQSEADGHDGTLLRELLNTDFKGGGVPLQKSELPAAQAIDELLEDFKSEHGPLDPRKIQPAQAEKLAELLLNVQPNAIEQHIAYLETARLLAIRAGNSFLTEDAIIELELLAEINPSEVYVESFLSLTKQNLDRDQVRRLMETAIPFLKSPAAQTADARKVKLLTTQLAKLAKQAEFVDSLRRLSQLAVSQ